MDNILRVDLIDNQQLSSNKRYGYLYQTTNLINGKKYIGVHRSSTFDESYKGSGKLLWKAINKYGWDNFKTEILCWCSSKEELYNLEKDYILKHRCVESNDYYNIADGGNGGCTYVNLPESEYDIVINKIRNSKKNRPLTEKEQKHLNKLHSDRIGCKMSEESKEKSRQSNLGQKRSEETCKNISNARKGCYGNKNNFYGKKHSNESKNKISKNNAKAHKGKFWITNKVDKEILVLPEELNKYPNFVRGRLRKSQRKKFND